MDTEGRKIPAEYYAASYKNNTKAGKATVTVRFKDGYSGTVKKAFTIRPAGTSIQKLTAASGGFAVKWKKKTAQVSGYQIQYSADKGFKGSSTRSVSVKKASITGKEVKKTESREKILCAHPHLQNGKGGWEKHSIRCPGRGVPCSRKGRRAETEGIRSESQRRVHWSTNGQETPDAAIRATKAGGLIFRPDLLCRLRKRHVPGENHCP